MRTSKRIVLLPAALLLLAVAVPESSGQTLLGAPPDPRLLVETDTMEANAATDSAQGRLPFPFPKLGDWVGFAKWISLGSAAGFGSLGFVLKRDADELFDRLEARCEADADACRERRPDGSYQDPALEELYQRVLDRDGQAQLTLIGAQVAFGLSVAFFIADFARAEGPSNIPYDPEQTDDGGLQVTAIPGEIALRWYFE